MAAAIGNKYALGNNGGRPAAYEDSDSLINEVKSYFDYCSSNKEKATITGLTLYLGFSSRSSLDDYCNKSEEFAYIIKRAKLAVENSYELNGQTIDIFALKNMGWKDKTEVDQRTTIQDEAIDLTKLSTDELRLLAEIQSKGRAGKAGV